MALLKTTQHRDRQGRSRFDVGSLPVQPLQIPAPPESGCTQPRVRTLVRPRNGPAPAGMNRMCAAADGRRTWWPRTGGDEPGHSAAAALQYRAGPAHGDERRRIGLEKPHNPAPRGRGEEPTSSAALRNVPKGKK